MERIVKIVTCDWCEGEYTLELGDQHYCLDVSSSYPTGIYKSKLGDFCSSVCENLYLESISKKQVPEDCVYE